MTHVRHPGLEITHIRLDGRQHQGQCLPHCLISDRLLVGSEPKRRQPNVQQGAD